MSEIIERDSFPYSLAVWEPACVLSCALMFKAEIGELDSKAAGLGCSSP